ncbi:phage/plasmid replication protein [Pontibacter sp. 13R65]|uniref:phage/plasmid replication domain-containing protein n=1 Tax=Pontibacter sp. 13R65 TaxID=3127458 RepID=UPI00301C589E
MYDTTKLFISQEQAGSNLVDCLPYLTNLSETYKQQSGQTYVTGNAGNLRVCVSGYGISIAGSLPKFYAGTNLHTLNRGDCKRAFEMMADTLHLPVQKANVSRLDFGLNLITQYKPELYYPYLGQSSYYNRLTQPKSISYQNKLRSKKFYNKVAECKSTGVAIPEVYQDKHLLRYEVCYMQRLPKQFNQAIITPNTLTDESFYMGMYDRWYKEYSVIEKKGLLNMDTRKINTPDDYLKQLLGLAIQEKGLEAILHHVEVLREQNTFKHAAYYSNLKKALKQLSNSSTYSETPELLQELNKKVARAKQSYR